MGEGGEGRRRNDSSGYSGIEVERVGEYDDLPIKF